MADLAFDEEREGLTILSAQTQKNITSMLYANGEHFYILLDGD